ncbi:MAG: glucosaminidase domain-containing protein, partial [Clostridiales bacterium]
NSDFGYVPNNDQDMRTKTGFTPTQLELCLTDQLSGQGESFAQAEQTYGVNALFLIAICQLESANGTSKLAVNKNNLAGLKTRNGFARFTSFADCIDHLAAMLAEKYLAPTGGFYHGSTIQGTSVTYCGGSTHWIKVVSKNIQKNYQLICAN